MKIIIIYPWLIFINAYKNIYLWIYIQKHKINVNLKLCKPKHRTTPIQRNFECFENLRTHGHTFSNFQFSQSENPAKHIENECLTPKKFLHETAFFWRKIEEKTAFSHHFEQFLRSFSLFPHCFRAKIMLNKC